MTRVVMIDDDDRLARIVTGILSEDGIDVVATLDDSEDVVRTVSDLDPDVVLVDMMLPTQPGLDVAEAIRRLRPDQPIVLFSSLFDPRVERIAVANGLIYLEKCEGIEALESAIFAAIERRHVPERRPRPLPESMTA